MVLVPGGEHPTGIGVKVFGAPTLGLVERFLLFLRPSGLDVDVLDQLALRFPACRAHPAASWVRDLTGSHRLDASEARPRLPSVLGPPAGGGVRWLLAARARGERPGPLPPRRRTGSELRSLAADFTLQFGNQGPIRRFSFDDGNIRRLVLDQRGQTGLPGGRARRGRSGSGGLERRPANRGPVQLSRSERRPRRVQLLQRIRWLECRGVRDNCCRCVAPAAGWPPYVALLPMGRHQTSRAASTT